MHEEKMKIACRFFPLQAILLYAVRAGFEPAVRFKGVRQFSKLLLSASQAPHRKTDLSAIAARQRWRTAKISGKKHSASAKWAP